MALAGESISDLSSKNQKFLASHMNEGESLEFFIVGASDQAVVALSDRLLVLKSGLLAGATFGGRAASFYYQDITSVEVNTGLLNGVIEICCASHQGSTQKDYWSSDKNSDPFKVSNCIPITKRNLKVYDSYLKRLREMIAASKQPHSASADASGLAVALEKLAALSAQGVITDEEYAQAKRKLLGM